MIPGDGATDMPALYREGDMSFRKIIAIVALAVTALSVGYDLAARPADASGGTAAGTLTTDREADARRGVRKPDAGAGPA